MELRLQELKDIVVYNDNRSTKLLAENHVFYQRTKHIDIRHFVRDSKEGIKLEYLPIQKRCRRPY